MKRLKRWLLLGVLFLVLVTVLMLAACYFFLATEGGFRLASSEISKRVEGLEIGKVSGTLSNGIQTDSVRFANKQVSIAATGIESRWRGGCLLDREVCIDKVQIEQLDIEAFATGEATAKPDSQADIALPAVSLPLSFSAKDVVVRKLNLQLPGDAPLQTLENIELSAFSDGNTIRIDKLATTYDNISLQLQGSITPDKDYPLDIEFLVNLDDVIEQHDINARISLSNTLDNLDIEADISGAVEARLQGRASPLKKQLPLSINVSSPAAGWPLDTRQQIEASSISLDISGDMDDYHAVLKANINGEHIPPTVLSINSQANAERALVTDLTAFTLGGFITGDAAVSWQNGITWVSNLVARDINPGVRFDGADGQLDGIVLASGGVENGQWTLDVDRADIEGTLRQYPLALQGKLQKHANNTWVVEKLGLDNGPNSIVASGSVSDSWDIKASAELPRLANLWPGLDGALSSSVELAGPLQTPTATIKASSPSATFNDIRINGLFIDSAIERAALDPSTFVLALGDVTAGTQSLRNVRVNLNGTRDGHTLKLFADGPQQTSINMRAQGGLNTEFDWNGAIENAKIEVPAHTVELANSVGLAWNQQRGQFMLDKHCWAIEDATLCLLDPVTATDSGSARVRLDGYGLQQLNPFIGAGAEFIGSLGAELTSNWGKQYEGGYSLNLDAGISNGGVIVPDANGLPVKVLYDSLDLNTTADAAVITGSLNIDSRSIGQVGIELEMDPAPQDKPIQGQFDIDGLKLGFIKAFVQDFDEIAGEISAGGEIGGTLLEPQINGQVALNSLVAKDDSLPLPIDGGDIQAGISGNRAVLSGTLFSGEGKVALTGSANWQRNDWQATLKLDGEKLAIRQSPITDSEIAPSISIVARPAGIRVRGKVAVPMAQVNILELPKGATALSEDIIVVEDIVAEQKESEEVRTNAIGLDVAVDVTLGDDVNLSGYGLDASLTGDMKVSMQSPNPVQLGGEIRIVKGVYRQYGQNLTVSDGQILFVGPVDQTALNIDAIREIDGEDRIAGLHIDGRLENPEISLFTEPADKAQEAILSYIVLGRDISETNDQEANLLASAALALTLKGGRGMATSVAEGLGIKEFTLDARGRGDDTEVVVSGRVNDRLLLRYGRSVFESESTLYLRYDITRQLYLEAAQGAARAVDIFYSFSF